MLCMYFTKILIIFVPILQHTFTKSCHKELKLNWTVSISDSAVVSLPLLAKLNKNDKHGLVVTTLDGSGSVIDPATGEEGSQWPVHFPEESFYSGPLLYDINQDGSMDILLTTDNGKIMFLSQNGTVLARYTTPLPWLMVKREWYVLNIHTTKHSEYDLSPEKNTRFITADDYNEHHDVKFKSFVVLDTHILSTPVIGDFSGDGINSDLIIPVNYYFDNEVKSNEQRLLLNLTLDKSNLDFYQASGLIVVDLRTREIIYNTTFELTMKSSSLPSYLLSSPTVIDLDGNYGSDEVIFGSASGRIHVWNKDGQYPWSFDLSDSIAGKIAVGDVNDDGHLEVIAVDKSANVMCYSKEKLIWEAIVSGTVTAGAQLYDIDNDNKVEVVIATNDGYIWVLDSETGQVLPKWPVSLGNEIHSHVLLQTQPDNLVDMYIMSGGNLNILGGNTQCLEVIPTDEISYTPVIYDWENMAFIVSTSDGAILSFSNLDTNKSNVRDKFGIVFTKTTNELHTVTTASFDVEFEIYGSLVKGHNWESRVVISYATETGVTHHISKYDKPGVYLVTLPSPKVPKRTYILIEFCDRFKQCTQDRIFISFHQGSSKKLVLYAVLPLLVMVVLLLLIHGYPESDLLPMWSDSSKKQ
ncbi:Hypothetical predicted protein [Paramuricea clavata]|uniref:DEX1 C-terminal domain-containing protein n=1 Tax=Paramuricea clavata TaxID=317549 RepID=A0A6S7H6Z9_PARCT|nr:Hypothetical predicted protein [Paramuricea clavata]